MRQGLRQGRTQLFLPKLSGNPEHQTKGPALSAVTARPNGRCRAGHRLLAKAQRVLTLGSGPQSKA